MRSIVILAACIAAAGSALAGDYIPISPEFRDALTVLIQGRGYDCPMVKLVRSEGRDVYGTVTKIRCGPADSDGVYDALAFRVTVRPNHTYLVAPW